MVKKYSVDGIAANNGNLREISGLQIEGGFVNSIETKTARSSVGPKQILFRPIANAHDHGRPFSPARFGVRDEQLETWLPGLARLPKLEPYASAIVAMSQAAESGTSGLVVTYDSISADDMISGCRTLGRAASDVGIRVGIALSVRDHPHVVYGDPEFNLIALNDASETQSAKEIWAAPRDHVDTQIEAIGECASEAPQLVDIQIAPVGPQWCSNAALEAIAEDMVCNSRRAQMHLLETKLQREWADASFGKEGLLTYLDSIGLLSQNLSLAHGVWLSRREMELLAERGVTIVSNTSSNIRLNSGLAPLHEFRKLGINVALGADSMAIFCQGNMKQEWALTRLVHGANKDPELDDWLSNCATVTGHQVVSGHLEQSDLIGSPADFIVQKWDGSYGVDPTSKNAWEFLRSSVSVDLLVVNGVEVVRKGKVVQVDRDAALDELETAINRWSRLNDDCAALTEAYRRAVRRFYSEGCHTRDRRDPITANNRISFSTKRTD